MQMDKKALFLPCCFGASSPQAIGVTRIFRNRSDNTYFKTFGPFYVTISADILNYMYIVSFHQSLNCETYSRKNLKLPNIVNRAS